MTTDSSKRDVALVVDDSPETLRLLTDALDGAGMTVMVAIDGAAAMRIVDQITPDIVLLDAVMPGMDGFETCRRLKRDAGPDQCAGHLHDRPRRDRAYRARAGSRRRRLRDKADRDRGDAGAHSGSSGQCQDDAERADRARCLRPFPDGGERPGQDHVGDAAGAETAVGQLAAGAGDELVLPRADAAMARAGAKGQGRREDP